MHVQYSTLLVAAVFSSGAITLTVLMSWMITRKERHLILGCTGLALVSLALALMSLRNGRYDTATLAVPFSLILAGLSFIHASIRLFLHRTRIWPSVVLGASTIVLTTTPFFLGLMGLGGIAIEVAAAVILALCAFEYFTARDEVRSTTLTIAALYLLIAVTYFTSAVLLAMEGEWILYPIEERWYDSINAAVSLVGITGIGALTLTLHFARAARLHHAEANTDPLTGALNRRALFNRFAETDIIPGLPVLLFDLDCFKLINDHFGHATGDVVLQRFSAVLHAHTQADDVVARIGGEEFCMVLPGQDRNAARARAEEIRAAFAALDIPSGRPDAPATVSVGLATGGSDETFDSVLSRADAALYRAKSKGRNRVHLSEQQQPA